MKVQPFATLVSMTLDDDIRASWLSSQQAQIHISFLDVLALQAVRLLKQIWANG
jgi:hypothetical protein